MKYIKLLLIPLLLVISTGVFAEVIKEVPSIFAFKVNEVKDDGIKFSFAVKNKSNISKFNYVLKLEGAEGKIVSEKKYDQVLNISPGKVKGKAFTFPFDSNKEINRAILYLTDLNGTILSLSILDDLKIKPQTKIEEQKDIKCEFNSDELIECQFFNDEELKGIEKVKVEIFQRSFYGPLVYEKELSNSSLIKKNNKVFLKIDSLKPGYYEGYVNIDNFKKSKLSIHKEGEMDLISSIFVKNSATKKGELIELQINYSTPNSQERILKTVVVDKDNNICAFSNKFPDNKSISLELKADCLDPNAVSYLLDQDENILASYNSTLKSYFDIKNYEAKASIKSIQFNKIWIFYGVIALLFVIALILIFSSTHRKKGYILLFLAILISLLFAGYSKVSAANIDNNFIKATINAPDVSSDEDIKINISIQDKDLTSRNPDTVIILRKGNDDFVDSNNLESTDVSFNLGPESVGAHTYKIVFLTEAKFAEAKFGQSRYGSNREEVSLTVNVTIACEGNTYWDQDVSAGDVCKGGSDEVKIQMCDNGTTTDTSDDFATGVTETVVGTKPGDWTGWSPSLPDDLSNVCKTKSFTRKKRCSDDYGNMNIEQDKQTRTGKAASTTSWVPFGSDGWKASEQCPSETWKKITSCGTGSSSTEIFTGTNIGQSCCTYDDAPDALSADWICKGATETYRKVVKGDGCPVGAEYTVTGTQTPTFLEDSSICIGKPYTVPADNCKGATETFIGTNTSGSCSALECSTDKISWVACGYGESITMPFSRSSLYVRTERNIDDNKEFSKSIQWSFGDCAQDDLSPKIDGSDKERMVTIKPGPEERNNDDKFYDLEVKASNYTDGCKTIKLKYVNPVVVEI